MNALIVWWNSNLPNSYINPSEKRIRMLKGAKSKIPALFKTEKIEVVYILKILIDYEDFLDTFRF